MDSDEADICRAGPQQTYRIGQGIDIHPFCDGCPLLLGGIEIPCERGLAGHSDADVLLHALIDALLGAVAAGDIGSWFPDADEAWKKQEDEVKYVPLQAKEGDMALYLQNSGYEIEFNKEKYIILPHSSILMFIRDEGLFE